MGSPTDKILAANIRNTGTGHDGQQLARRQALDAPVRMEQWKIGDNDDTTDQLGVVIIADVERPILAVIVPIQPEPVENPG